MKVKTTKLDSGGWHPASVGLLERGQILIVSLLEHVKNVYVNTQILVGKGF